MNNFASFFSKKIHPMISNLNIRTISKIITHHIIQDLELQCIYDAEICKKLNVSAYLNSFEAIAFFVDDSYFEKYGFSDPEIITFQDLINCFKSDLIVRIGNLS